MEGIENSFRTDFPDEKNWIIMEYGREINRKPITIAFLQIVVILRVVPSG
jgi:hypothetical protein